MIKITPATISHIPAIQELSNIVWPITFGSILSKDQIAYMMNMMYSTPSLTKQMEEGHNYVLASDDNAKILAYLSYQHMDEYTKVHKIYVLPNTQGSGIGKLLIGYIVGEAKKAKKHFLTLNVNRYNKALDFYTHLGFEISRTENIDIGNNFLMEDYVMVMHLTK